MPGSGARQSTGNYFGLGYLFKYLNNLCLVTFVIITPAQNSFSHIHGVGRTQHQWLAAWFDPVSLSDLSVIPSHILPTEVIWPYTNYSENKTMLFVMVCEFLLCDAVCCELKLYIVLNSALKTLKNTQNVLLKH